MIESASPLFAPVIWEGDHFRVLDETLLPWSTRYIAVTEASEAVEAVKEMKTRAFGQVLTLLYSAVLVARSSEASTSSELSKQLRDLADAFSAARPTFHFNKYNPFFDDSLKQCPSGERVGRWLERKIHERVAAILHARDRRAQTVAELLRSPCRLMTHCNISGELVAVARHCRSTGKDLRIVVTETRPYLQGTRLTAWELAQAGVYVEVIPDGAIAQVMRHGQVDVALVGSDRCARNGDIINKVGTYPFALMAKEYGIPFYALVQDPGLLPTGAHMAIEERPVAELFEFQGRSITSEGVQGRYPAFDVTPAALVSALIGYEGTLTPQEFKKKYDVGPGAIKENGREPKRFIALFGVPGERDYARLARALKEERAQGVVVPEMRPELWGARRVARELASRGIPITFVSDNMMGTLFLQEDIRCLFLFCIKVSEQGPVGICGSLLAAHLARLHGVRVKWFESGTCPEPALDETVATFMGYRVCPEQAAVYPVELETIPWALVKDP